MTRFLPRMAVVAIALGVLSTQARALTLAQLISQGSITVGDKTFSNFTYVPSGSAPAAGDINVTAINNSLGIGLEFQSGFIATPLGSVADGLLAYDVQVNTPGVFITDWHLGANPAFAPPTGTGSVTITDSFTGVGGAPPLILTQKNDGTPDSNQLTLTATSPPPTITPAGGVASGNFVTPVTSLHVRKDILLSSGTAFASISFVDQIASQSAVPEPTTMVMAALALPLLLTVARRRSKALGRTAA